MARRMLVDATHPEETRVTVVNGNRLEEFDYETATKAQLKGNIYLAKVTRVEPSLQAAFVEYGGNRHGFLAFSEIHPDYYRIPVGDREEFEDDDQSDDDDANDEEGNVEELGGDEGADEAVEQTARRRPRLKRQYKIQEVIKRRQVLLVQVVKEERGNKGAALTTYLSLAGRYCVLMPNTSRGGGVSRKITNGADRKRLKSVLAELSVPQGMAVIVRTAGSERSKAEIRRDFDYIFKLWDQIRTATLESTAPALIHEEANLIKRSLRDLYSKDMEEILVAGDEGYRIAKNFMKALIPSHAKKVQPYKDDQGIPLFQRFQVETQLNAIHDPVVHLRSGGSIVIHQTEALVAIDVNSGRATRERHIEETALKTNLEAAEEVARQLRLRDLAGLIVIDFIDMDENKNDHAVERKLKEALRRDRARIQVGRISPFGLLEMSRQRLRPSLLEAMSQPCPTCGGVGYIQSTESAALAVLRAIEEEGLRKRSIEVTVKVPTEVALYILNHKRGMLAEIEAAHDFKVILQADGDLLPPNFELSRIGGKGEEAEVVQQSSHTPSQDDDRDGKGRKRRRRSRRGRKRDDEVQAGEENQDEAEEDSGSEDSGEPVEAGAGDEEDAPRKRRKRGRRGGRRRRGRRGEGEGQEAQEAQDGQQEPSGEGDAVAAAEGAAEAPAEAAAEDSTEDKPKRSRRRRKPRDEAAEAAADAAPAPEVSAEPVAEEEAPAEKPKRARRSRKKVDADVAQVEAAGENAPVEAAAPAEAAEPAVMEAEAAPESGEEKPKRAKKARAKKATAKKARAKKASAKKASAKKAAARKAAPKEAVAEDAPAEAVAESAPAAVEPAPTPAPAAVEPAPAVAAEAPAPEPQVDENKPKRKGWWSRVLS